MNTPKISITSTSKILLLAVLFFFVGIQVTLAQKRGGKNENATPTEKAEKRSQKWKTEFNLNDTQTAQLKTALEKRITATDALKGQGKSPEKTTQMKAIMTQFDTEVKGFLTSEQWAAYEKKKAEKKENRKDKRKEYKDNKDQDLDDDGF